MEFGFTTTGLGREGESEGREGNMECYTTTSGIPRGNWAERILRPASAYCARGERTVYAPGASVLKVYARGERIFLTKIYISI